MYVITARIGYSCSANIRSKIKFKHEILSPPETSRCVLKPQFRFIVTEAMVTIIIQLFNRDGKVQQIILLQKRG